MRPSMFVTGGQALSRIDTDARAGATGLDAVTDIQVPGLPAELLTDQKENPSKPDGLLGFFGCGSLMPHQLAFDRKNTEITACYQIDIIWNLPFVVSN